MTSKVPRVIISRDTWRRGLFSHQQNSWDNVFWTRTYFHLNKLKKKRKKKQVLLNAICLSAMCVQAATLDYFRSFCRLRWFRFVDKRCIAAQQDSWVHIWWWWEDRLSLLFLWHGKKNFGWKPTYLSSMKFHSCFSFFFGSLKRFSLCSLLLCPENGHSSSLRAFPYQRSPFWNVAS